MDIDEQIRHDKHSDHDHSDDDYSFEDWKGMYCPYMYNCPYMYGMMPYKHHMYRDDEGEIEDDLEDVFEDEFEDDPDDALEAIRPMHMHRPRCRWPFRPCWYGGRWHCCRRRRRRPRPRPYWMY